VRAPIDQIRLIEVREARHIVLALHDNTRTPPPDQAAFRIDWPAFLETRSDRDRALIGRMALGERTLDLAGDFGMSPARVSQLRREFLTDWRQFVGDK
jgi:hypothetical protein